MSEKKIEVRGGMGLGTTLFLIFLILKLTGHINWSWWWITAPLWIPLVLILVFLIIFAIASGR